MKNTNIFSQYALLSLFCGLSPLNHADDTIADPVEQSPEKQTNYILGLALTTGGDELAKVLLVDEYGDRSTKKIEAGGLIYFYGGMQLNNFVFPLRFILGYLTDRVDASNGSVSFSRFPVEISALHTAGPHAFGIGLSYHLSPELDMSDAGLDSYKADDALGWLLMYEYSLESNVSIGVRYTNISYDFGGEDVDGSNAGVSLNIKF